MNTMFKNFDGCLYENEDGTKLIGIACKDRTVRNEERWVVVTLTCDEAKKLCECLHKWIDTNSEEESK